MQSFPEMLRSAGVPAPHLSCQEGEIDGRWRALTAAGNLAYANGHDADAMRLYEDALAEAERMFDAAREGGSPLLAPMLYNISCANAAETKMRGKDATAALSFLLRAFDKLVMTAASVTSPMPLRANCVRHLRYTFEVLVRDFAAECERAEVKSLFARGADAAKEVGRIAGWIVSRYRTEDQAQSDQTLPYASRLN
jgi:hypothetical protein